MTQPYSGSNFQVFLGIDVSKNSYSVTVKDQTAMNRSKTIPANPQQMYNYIQKHYSGQPVVCAYEAGPTGFGLYDYMVNRNQPCLVVSPLSIAKAPNQKVKNNRMDSDRIASELKAGRLHSIRVPQGVYREVRLLIESRENYSRQSKVTKQRIKSLLLYTGLHETLRDEEQHWSQHYLSLLKNLECTPATRHRLDMLLMDLDYARKQLLSVIKELRRFCKNDPEIYRYSQYLQSIPGIGFTTAVTILGRIGNPAELKNVRELAGFTGLVPTEHSTGDDIHHGSITHLGNSTLRSLLVETAWVAIRKDAELREFYHRIKNRHHPSIGPRKAIVAVARKLTQRVYRVLKDQRNYVVH